MKPNYFKRINGDKIPLPVFFPDATRAIVRTIDSADIEQTKTPGILVNTYHLYKDVGKNVIKTHNGIGGFMSWNGAVISDSGGFQVMSLVKRKGGQGKVTDEGVTVYESAKKHITLTPEKSVAFQMLLKSDMVVVLDDYTPPDADRKEAKISVDRTIEWARRSKEQFEDICAQKKLSKSTRPYLLAVIQGGKHYDLREYCAQELIKIGFDGFGFGGWPMNKDGTFNYDVVAVDARLTPDGYLLYGLGVGKPHEIVKCVDLGYDIFDCVLPTRDARHKRMYVYNADSMETIDIRKEKFYSFYTPDKEKYYNDKRPVSEACDCLLCTRYSRAYLAHLFRIQEVIALRLATIHNLRFYSLLMEKLQNQINKGAKEQ